MSLNTNPTLVHGDPRPETVKKKVEHWKNSLFDMSGRNRLLYFKPARASTVDLSAPDALELFDRLVVKGRTMTFPLPEAEPQPDELIDSTPVDSADGEPAPDEGETGDDEQTGDDPNMTNDGPVDEPASDPAPKKAATRQRRKANELDTPHSDRQLTRALYNLYNRSRIAREEQGVNLLFVAFGFLRWRETASGSDLLAPLVLVPVDLMRPSLAQPYQLKMLEEDILINPTLSEKLRRDYKVDLPPIDDQVDAAGLEAYWANVKAQIMALPNWDVVPAASLNVFSFQDLIIVSDLERNISHLVRSPIVQRLSGIPVEQPGLDLIPAEQIDARVTPNNSFMIMDADSSQHEAVLAAKAGLSFVLQGPPGTGKSQTITNMIAEFMAMGKRVLFVSEKMAALEVVYRRLARAGLGDYCLEVHSHNRNKREVVQELGDSLRAQDVIDPPNVQSLFDRLRSYRQSINGYVMALHLPRFMLEMSVFEMYGELARLADAPVLRFTLPNLELVTRDRLNDWRDTLNQLERFPQVISVYNEHPWRGVRVESVSLTFQSQLTEQLEALAAELIALRDAMHAVEQSYGVDLPDNLRNFGALLHVAQVFAPGVTALDLATLVQQWPIYQEQRFKALNLNYRRDRSRLLAVSRQPDRLNDAKLTLRDLHFAKYIQHFRTQPIAPETPGLPGSGPYDLADISQRWARLIERLRYVRSLYAPNRIPALLAEDGTTVFDEIAAWCRNHATEMAALRDWVGFNRVWTQGVAQGLAPFLDRAVTRSLAADQWQETFFKQLYTLLVDKAVEQAPVLETFQSDTHTTLIEGFRELDRQHMVLTRRLIQARLTARRPRAGWMSAASAEESILRRELNKKRRLKPLRRLFAEIPELILNLRPVMMMSPLTVSQLLDPELHRFDVVIFDEASQIPPGHAIGAFIRAGQAIVVGDRHQLPPTSFFKAMEADAGQEDEETADDDFESILNEFDAAGFPSQMLRWHYRSRDESLIAFSNRHFYSERLFTFPSSDHDDPDRGLSFVHVPDGVYDRQTNPVEAEQIAGMIVEHYRTQPHRSLGVIAFSSAQAYAIRHALEQRQRNDPELENTVADDPNEPLFIKHLEIVQGDERDVILFGVGYGPAPDGRMRLNFGPLNKDGGERRLNVAVTRARYQLKLVASFQPEAIDLSRAESHGARLLKSYMTLARDGVNALRTSLDVDLDAAMQSAFEDVVFDTLTQHGLHLHRKVGVSNYRIDMAIVDDSDPGRYKLGIECDGPMYRSAATARDRDRLRAQVLAGLGWELHRVWSRDWIENRDAEIARIMARLGSLEANEPDEELADEVATAQASQFASATDFAAAVAAQARLIDETAQHAAIRHDERGPEGVVPYREIDHLQGLGGLQGFYITAINVRLSLIKTLVDHEGPIHTRRLAKRMAEVFDIPRVTKKLREEIEGTIRLAVSYGLIEEREDFLWPAGMRRPPVRVPAGEDRPRSVDDIAIEELAEAAYIVMKAAKSLETDDLVKETARLFGQRATAKSTERLNLAIERLFADGRVEWRSDKIRLMREDNDL